MVTMNELLEKRARAWQSAKDFLDTHTPESGILTAEDDATYSKMEADIESLTKAIDRAKRAEDFEKQMQSATSDPILGNPGTATDEKTGRASDAYRKAFVDMLRKKNPGAGVLNALQIGTDSEGGYLVPDEFEKMLIQGLEEEEVMRGLATVITTNSGDHKIPVVASHGTASWIDEEGSYSDSDDAFTQVVIGAHKVGTAIKVSEELLNDSAFNLEAYIANEFARRIGRAEETAYFTGNGTGKPTGLLASAQTGVTAAETTAIDADEVIDLFYSLGAPYRAKATWVMNDATAKLIRKLKNGDGTYLWQPALTASQPDMILGRPVKTSSAMPTAAASAKLIAFGDMSYYWIADRQSFVMQKLMELYAMTGQIGFKAFHRVDGKLILPEAVKTLVMAAS